MPQQLRDLQTRARNGNSTLEEWKFLFLSRTPQYVNNITDFETFAVKLSLGNEKVAIDNFMRLKQLGEPLYRSKHITPTLKQSILVQKTWLA